MFTSIAIIGRPNVGKSSLFNKLTRSRDAIVSDFPGLTKDRNYGYFESKHKKTLLIDTGGISQSNDGLKGAISQQAWIAVQESSLIILLIDGPTLKPPQHLGSHMWPHVALAAALNTQATTCGHMWP